MAERLQLADYRELIGRLPRTFGPSLNNQLTGWDLLFPAEQRQLRGQLNWLARLPAPELKTLFDPVTDIEGQMELPKWNSATKLLSVEDSGVLARSPLYPKWRQAVEKAFTKIDEGVGASAALPVLPRLVACVLPPGLPASSKDPLWPELTKQGTWIELDGAVSGLLPAFVPAMTGRRRRPDVEDEESTWIYECDEQFEGLAASKAVVLDWKSLEPARRQFLTKLNAIKRDLKSVDETNADLKRTDLSKLLPRPVAERPRVREFVRNLLLSGNGSLVFPSSFVQWGAAETLRRAQPQVLLALFGMRQKLKPFSSSVLFEDQHRNNPAADADDPAGTLIDAQILAEYVYLAARRTAAYQTRTLGMMALAGLDRVLLLGELPEGLRGSMKTADFMAVLMRWVEPAL
jgi:hypothetical protein